MGRYEDLPPRADAMISSMRAMGYDLAMAIADLIDNSIFAGAKNIWIKYHWAGPDSWIYILDDGCGMYEEKLREAMRLGSQSPTEARDPEDLGRFGLGMKTASFSQSRILTVYTKTSDEKKSVRCWDLNHVEKTKKWQLDTLPPDNTEEILSNLDELSHGTLVLWQGLDRIIEIDDEGESGMGTFYSKFLSVLIYLEMVFHRYLSSPSKLNITLGEVELKPWDPYLKSNQFTQELSSDRYDDGTIEIVPYVLPHISKRSSTESSSGAGPKGWNAQQGYYLYRNKRMIISGGYLNFDIKPEEHYKLARIMVDIDNKMDHEWGIDVRKATAKPPDRLRAELDKVARATRKIASDVYRARMGTTRASRRKSDTGNVWKRVRKGDKITYEINKSSEVIKEILSEQNPPPAWTAKLFHVIETTVPYRLILMDNNELEDCHVDLPLDLTPPSKEMINLCIVFYNKHRENGRSHEVALDLIMALEPFNTHPAYRASLDSLKNEGGENG